MFGWWLVGVWFVVGCCVGWLLVAVVVLNAVTAIVVFISVAVTSVKVLMIFRIFGCVVAVAEVWLLMAIATEGFVVVVVVVVVVAVVVLTSSSSTSTATSPVLASPLAAPST